MSEKPASTPREARWSGEGPDPWLPDRIDSMLQAAEHESEIRSDLWTAMSRWLVAVRRSVLAAPRPDPNAVWAHNDSWTKSVRKLVAGSIKDAIGSTYARLFGSGYRYDQRPAVVTHLAEVENRLVHVPDEVFNVISSEIAEGAAGGDSIPDIAAKVAATLDVNGSERWENRATVIARTETIGALNAGRDDSYTIIAEDDPEEGYERMWLATLDSRTRESHKLAEGQRSPIGGTFEVGKAHLRHPGDPAGPAEEVIQCRCSTVLLLQGEKIDLSGRQVKD